MCVCVCVCVCTFTFGDRTVVFSFLATEFGCCTVWQGIIANNIRFMV